MTELTKEWLQQTIKDIEDVLNHNQNKGNDSDVVNMLAALKIAQSSLRADTVLYMNRFTRKAFTLDEQPGADKEPNIYVPLYAVPPAPVVPDAIDGSRLAHVYLEETMPSKVDAYVCGWNACRAAMLQGKGE